MIKASDLYVVGAYTNINRYNIRPKLARKWVQESLDCGVSLTVVEHAVGETPYEFSKDEALFKHVNLVQLFGGHFHQSICIPQKLIFNGSLPGPNEYSRNMLRSMPEAPSQTLIMMHTHFGMTDYQRVFVEDASPIAGAYKQPHSLNIQGIF